MAAGDVTVNFDTGRGIGRQQRLIAGTVVLDGGNATPIALAAYFKEVKGSVVSISGSTAPGVDPTQVSSAISGTTVNVYAWKITATGDGTLIASTDNARVVNFVAWGRP